MFDGRRWVGLEEDNACPHRVSQSAANAFFPRVCCSDPPIITTEDPDILIAFSNAFSSMIKWECLYFLIQLLVWIRESQSWRSAPQPLRLKSFLRSESVTHTSSFFNIDNQIRPSTTDKARTVTYVCTSGTLCTTLGMEGVEGIPFGSYVDYIIDEKGWPILLLNSQSLHSQNIKSSR